MPTNGHKSSVMQDVGSSRDLLRDLVPVGDNTVLCA